MNEFDLNKYGVAALTKYQNAMVDWYRDNYTLTYAQLQSEVLSKNPTFLRELGVATQQSKLGERRLKEAMERVVDSTPIDPLKIPRIDSFIKGITEEMQSFDFSLLGDASLDLVKAVSDQGKKVTDALGNVVTGVTDTVSIAGNALKYVLIAALLFGGFLIYKVGNKKADMI